MHSWENSKEKLGRVSLKTKGSIEEENGSFQVDFANKFIGGGVLGYGCV